MSVRAVSMVDPARKLAAEFIGTALLLLAVVGSAWAAAELSPNDAGLRLLQNSLATAAALIAIIIALFTVSGAQINPAVTLANWLLDRSGGSLAVGYVIAQCAGAFAGCVLANVMFGQQAVEVSTLDRGGWTLVLSEAVATFGLVLIVFAAVRSGRTTLLPFAVGAYIGGAYFFTSSTSFANPAVTIARTVTGSFAGIDPASVPGFLLGQVIGVIVAVAVVAFLLPKTAPTRDQAPK